MRHFKLPLIVTAVTLLLAVVVGLAAVTWVHQSGLPRREKNLRAQALGAGTATATCVVIAPFWLVAAGRVGKERRAAKGGVASARKRTP